MYFDEPTGLWRNDDGTVLATVVSSADVLGNPARPLNADYWLNRHDGEGHPQFLRRRQADRLVSVARRHERFARRARRHAKELLQA